jgi:ferric-dicitrate binding protein FerR (iron transport regulator)
MQNDDEFSRDLKSLIPQSAGIDPIAAAFAAGKRSARRQIRGWQVSCLIAVLGAAMLWTGRSAPVQSQPTMAIVATAESRPPLSDASAIMMEQAALANGTDALPEWHSLTLTQSDKPNSL